MAHKEMKDWQQLPYKVKGLRKPFLEVILIREDNKDFGFLVLFSDVFLSVFWSTFLSLYSGAGKSMRF